MTLESFIAAVLGIGAVLLAPLIYIWKTMLHRIERLEEKIDTKIDEKTVRQLVSDKLDPLTQDIKELKDLVTKLLELELKRKD